MSAFVPVLVLAAVLTARWILVTGYGDFGTDYDLASRFLAGQWQGRDFFAVYPPLSGYSLLLFLRLLGDHYLVANIHVWFWWLLSAAVASGLVRAYGGSVPKAAFVGTAVVLLTVPPSTGGLSYELMASALSGVSVFLFVRRFQAGTGFLAGLAGACGGVCTLVKPNVGLSVIVSMAVVSFALAALRPGDREMYGRAGVNVLLGGVAGVMLAFAIPGFYGGYGEVARQIFVAGPEIKGGIQALILRSIPRISMTVTGPGRFMTEGVLSVLFIIGLVAVFGVAFRQTSTSPSASLDEATDVRLLLWSVCGFTAVLSAWSLFPWGVPHLLTAMFAAWHLVSLPFFLWQVLYMIVAVGLTMAITARVWAARGVRMGRTGNGANAVTSPLWVAVLSLLWTIGVVASARHNSPFASTLFVPALAMQFHGGHARVFYRAAAVFLIGWTLAWHVAPTWRSTFAHLAKLPAHSEFAGLYWPDGGASVPGSYPYWASSHTIEALQKNVSPRVAGETVLWLVPGPGAAFGGTIYRYGIDGIAPNSIPPAEEELFGEKVRLNPPHYIVSSTFADWNDSRWTFMRPGVIEPWLHAHYRLAWAMLDNPAPFFLWERK